MYKNTTLLLEGAESMTAACHSHDDTLSLAHFVWFDTSTNERKQHAPSNTTRSRYASSVIIFSS